MESQVFRKSSGIDCNAALQSAREVVGLAPLLYLPALGDAGRLRKMNRLTGISGELAHLAGHDPGPIP
jgi:hypothetical protein